MDEKLISENARTIAAKRYLRLDPEGKPIESIREMFQRISEYVAKAETDLSDKNSTYKKPGHEELDSIVKDFYDIQSNFEFLSGISLLDRGKNDLVAACYVMPIHDSIESIYGTLAETVVLHRRGAGVGYDFSEIRPEGTKIKSTGREASGPISFMRLYDFSSEVILNRGSVRHAGHMGILRIDHPDIYKFISAKRDYSQLTNFNISIAITDEFIDAVKNDKNFDLKYDGEVYKTLPARELLHQIVECIYASGEPGFVFVDEINRFNPTPNVGRMTATNLCGEQPLLPYEACNLGSIVLNKFVKKDEALKDLPFDQKIDWIRLEFVVKTGVRFLDNTITVSHHLLPAIEQLVKYGNRKIGLGVMGWADMLVDLNIPYNSQKALDLAEKIMKFIDDKGHEESEKLGKERGSFGNFKDSLWDTKGHKHMRNATVTTIAPNGTTSLFADCNGGIEPFFAFAYFRQNMETMGETKLVFMNTILENRLKSNWLYSSELMQEIAEKGTINNISKIPDSIKKVFVCAFDISPEWHIKMQGAFQKFTDNAVSKTINLPESATIKDIENAFKLATELHLKGLTIYRDKSRDKQVLNLKN